jgi:hypothetical protein
MAPRGLAPEDLLSGDYTTLLPCAKDFPGEGPTAGRADYGGVALTDKTVTYTGPTILWRLRHRDGRVARATLIPGSPTSTLVYFVDDRFERGENFEEWEPALRQAQVCKEELLADGWLEL